MTKDGALSFPEFCTAMHLVVLRVRNFELPNELPEKLQPYAPLIDFNNEAAPVSKFVRNPHEDSIVRLTNKLIYFTNFTLFFITFLCIHF